PARSARSDRLLARAPIASGQHQQDQGDRPLVQSELHPSDEGREVDGNPGEPHADAAAPGVSEAVEPAEDLRPVPTSEGGPSQPLALQPDLRLTSPGIRLAQVKEELVAWVKTLVSAAVYAVLIVTFGFQVARVEGQSM